MVVSSIHNERIAGLLRLDRKKVRDDTGTFVVEGPHLVGEAISAGLCQTVFAVDDPGYADVEIVTVTDTVMNRIAATYTPQGILAIVRKPENGTVGDRVLLLDGIQDPGNMGALLRSARAFGFTTVVADGCVDYYNAKTVRATQGALFRLNLIEAPLPAFIAGHPDFAVLGTDPHGGVPLDRYVADSPRIALLLGNEGAGVRPELLASTRASIVVETADVESLNVAVAGAIIMHRLRG